MENEKLVPKLRFSGFDDEWEETTLIDISDKIGDGMHATPNYVDKSEYFFINGNNLIDKQIVINENTKCVPLEEYESHKINFNNTILMSINGTIGNLAYYNNEKVILGKSSAYINLNDNINKEFIFNYLQIGKIKYYFQSELTGTTIKNLSLKTLKNTKINLPNLREQNKISDFLENVDKKISLLENKHKYYQDFKKYLMQQIFAQKLRFDFENDWEKFTLGDIGETYNGLSGLSKDNFEKGNSRYITYKSIFDNNVLIDDLTEPVDLNNKSQNNVEKGDLFFTGSSETPEEVGMVSVLNFDIDNCYLNSFCFGYRLKDLTKVNPIFLAYYLRSPIMRNKIQILAQGSTRFNLSKKEILKLKINVPEMKEQIKILDLMQNNDKLLKNTSCQITEMNLFKKSLLQQMFV